MELESFSYAVTAMDYFTTAKIKIFGTDPYDRGQSTEGAWAEMRRYRRTSYPSPRECGGELITVFGRPLLWQRNVLRMTLLLRQGGC